MAKSSVGSSAEPNSRTRGLKPWKPGQSGNPKGRRRGQRDYKTIFWTAICHIADANNLTPEVVEDAIHAKAIQRALSGDYFMYKELNERVFGKVKEGVEVEFKGKTLADVIAAAQHARSKPKASAPARKKRAT